MIKVLILFLFIGSNMPLLAQEEEKAFTYTEKMPQFVGGTEEMYRFVYTNIRSTKLCQQESARTQVIVQFVVDTTGYIDNPKIMKDNKSGCNDEALRVINLMNEGGPYWSPGEQNGRKVRVTFTLPILFNIK
ncbi:MAG: energy transducer TonB [Saprospiraceae bacterium]|uniref:Energy transducer TonB n=1 Tax=Candidatus Opimibacter skivensis TaxID=2982028 RepID=A0A9D7SXR8_9BACT|nr:energy transducer TonB [Candidatus Opimibacter skivensis]